MAVIRNRCHFHRDFRGSIHAASLCVGKPLQESRSNGICSYDRGSLCKDGAFHGLYASDLQNEGYPENLYVSRCGA